MVSRAFAKKVRIAPSLLAADLARLKDQIAQIEAGGADWLHVDVMDGVFVPNLTFGAKVIETCRSLTKLPLDVHLMVVEPEKYFETFAKAGASVMTIHVEVAPHLHRQVMHVKELGCAAGAAVNPGTSLDSVREVAMDLDLLLIMSVNPGFGGQKFIPRSLDRFRRLAVMRERRKLDFAIEVDGGITMDNIADVVRAGVTRVVAGSSIFHTADPSGATRRMKQLAEQATLVRV